MAPLFFFIFALLSKRETLPPHSKAQIVTVVDISEYNCPEKVLGASNLQAAEDIAQPRLFGGGNDALINPNEMISPSAPRAKAVQSLPKPVSIRKVKPFPSSSNLSRRLASTSSTSAFKARTDNQSSLSLNRIDSSLINGDVSDIFVGRPGNLGDRDSLLIANASRRARQGHTQNNQKNLRSMQRIEYSDFVYPADKRECRQDMDYIVNQLSAKAEEARADLNKLEEEGGRTEEIYAKEK